MGCNNNNNYYIIVFNHEKLLKKFIHCHTVAPGPATSEELQGRSPSPQQTSPTPVAAPRPDHDHERPLSTAEHTTPINVRLPTGSTVAVQTLDGDKIEDVKSKIEQIEPCYPCHHQRLVDPGICDDILDDKPMFKVRRFRSNHSFVLRGDLILSTVKLKIQYCIQTELLRISN